MEGYTAENKYIDDLSQDVDSLCRRVKFYSCVFLASVILAVSIPVYFLKRQVDEKIREDRAFVESVVAKSDKLSRDLSKEIKEDMERIVREENEYRRMKMEEQHQYFMQEVEDMFSKAREDIEQETIKLRRLEEDVGEMGERLDRVEARTEDLRRQVDELEQRYEDPPDR